MDSYIVHILRRHLGDSNEAVQLDGVVEVVEEGGPRLAFHNSDELWTILGGLGELNTVDGVRITTNNEE